MDLGRNQIFDVVLGRSEKSLESYLKRLKGRENVTLVVLDLSETYRSIVRKYFPNAKIVSDRFHVIRVVFQHFQKTWHALDPEARWKRGLGKLFRMHAWNLNEQQSRKVNQYLDTQPVVRALYEKRNELAALLLKKAQKRFQMRADVDAIVKLLQELRECGLESLRSLAETLTSWAVEIGRMWRTAKSNGVTEGFHNKMEVISRRAYGYRNFQNYRRRVLAMSGWDGVFAKRQRLRPARMRI